MVEHSSHIEIALPSSAALLLPDHSPLLILRRGSGPRRTAPYDPRPTGRDTRSSFADMRHVSAMPPLGRREPSLINWTFENWAWGAGFDCGGLGLGVGLGWGNSMRQLFHSFDTTACSEIARWCCSLHNHRTKSLCMPHLRLQDGQQQISGARCC